MMTKGISCRLKGHLTPFLPSKKLAASFLAYERLSEMLQ